MSSGQVIAAVGALHTAVDALAELSVDTLTHPELLAVLSELEIVNRTAPAIARPIIARLQREACPTALGAKSFKDLLCLRLRISKKEAALRLAEAKDLGPRTSFTGEPMPSILARTAAAQAQGKLGSEHVALIRGFFDDLPIGVDPDIREHAEQTLVEVACGFGPDGLRTAAKLLATLIDQDGPEPDDAERARKRNVRMAPQQSDGMSKLTGNLDPEFLATWEPLLAKFAAPGMCNPADAEPRISGTPTQEQIDADDRSYGQRVHDAMVVIGRMALASGDLGRHNGLPVTVIVSTTLQELNRGAGSAKTAVGSVIPMADLIRMASHAIHYLAVFDEHTNEPLYLGRAKRLASVGQRLVLLARDGGCTFPGCTVGGYGTQVHHMTGWAKSNGQTNINAMTLACGGDNRMAELGWTVQIRDGQVEWIPPPELDTGRARVNFYHHPQRLLMDPDPDEESG